MNAIDHVVDFARFVGSSLTFHSLKLLEVSGNLIKCLINTIGAFLIVLHSIKA